MIFIGFISKFLRYLKIHLPQNVNFRVKSEILDTIQP